jgi:phage tail-like protein
MADIGSISFMGLKNYLPAIYQEDTFINQFLLAFEKVILGRADHPEICALGLEEIIDRIHTYFQPGPGCTAEERTPTDFLSWLAKWFTLGLRDDWTDEEKRRLLSRIVPLYRQRGTKAGLSDLLSTYTGMQVEISDQIQPIQIGVSSTIGIDTMIGGAPPHYFLVRMYLGDVEPTLLSRRQAIAKAIIEQEKPAHTYYDLEILVPTMQIGVHSKVGVDTVLGKPISK